MKTAATTARKERLNRGLRTLASWAQSRAMGEHDDETTLTMLERKTAELRAAVAAPSKNSESKSKRNRRSPLRVQELSLRPYHGKLFVAYSVKGYERSHQRLFKTPDVLTCAQEGRFSGGEGKDGMWTYLVWGANHHTLAHELAHVVLHVFDRCGIDPREGAGEPFCYMLSQLLLEANAQADPRHD